MPATSRKPSPYPWYFHGLRLGQLLSSIVVGTVLCYFIDHLRDEDYPIPWTFILVSLIEQEQSLRGVHVTDEDP